MSMLPMRDAITILPKSDEMDEYGQPKTMAPVVFACFISSNSASKAITTAAGEEVVYEASIYFDGIAAIGYGDTVQLPSHTGQPSNKQILSINHKKDFFTGAIIMTKVVV